MEDFVEKIIRITFGDAYKARYIFQAIYGTAKCDFSIPNKEESLILVEAKAYGATGSKMSDVIGDVDAIIRAKQPAASLFLFTDGLTWKERPNDLQKLFQRHHEGRVTRIYTKQNGTRIQLRSRDPER